MRSRSLLLSAALLFSGSCGQAADLPKPKAIPGRVMLPQEHQYQRVLRKYLATLSEKDFDHGVTAKFTVAPLDPDGERQYRMFLKTLMIRNYRLNQNFHLNPSFLKIQNFHLNHLCLMFLNYH